LKFGGVFYIGVEELGYNLKELL